MTQSAVARHIIARVAKARRLDPTLTIRQAAAELGISESSIYKMRAGTRSGKGSIARRVMQYPKESGYTVTFTDGTRVASRNISVPEGTSRADALVLRHDPAVRRAIAKQLEREERGEARRRVGSPAWSRRERQRLRVTGVVQPSKQSTTAFIVHERRVPYGR